MPESELDPDDVRAIMLMLMQMNATLEELRDLLRDEDDENEEEPDA
jgi:hypothetical protein